MLRKRYVDARPTNRPPADVHYFNNQIFPSEILVKKEMCMRIKDMRMMYIIVVDHVVVELLFYVYSSRAA